MKHCSTDNVDLGIENFLRSIERNSVTCGRGRSQTILPVLTDLAEVRLDALTAFTNVGVDYFCAFIVKIERMDKMRRCCLFACLAMRSVLACDTLKFRS